MFRTRLARLPSRPLSLSSSRPFASTSHRAAEIQLEVDGIPVSIEQGSSIIQACEKAGTFSWVHRVEPAREELEGGGEGSSFLSKPIGPLRGVGGGQVVELSPRLRLDWTSRYPGMMPGRSCGSHAGLGSSAHRVLVARRVRAETEEGRRGQLDRGAAQQQTVVGECSAGRWDALSGAWRRRGTREGSVGLRRGSGSLLELLRLPMNTSISSLVRRIVHAQRERNQASPSSAHTFEVTELLSVATDWCLPPRGGTKQAVLQQQSWI